MPNKELNTDFFDKAMIFAINAHHGTERRGKQSPYIIHPMEAVEIVATITNDQELLAAAALHDVAEDTEFTIEDIRKEFGDRVAGLVESESDPVIDGKNETESWKERKQIGIERLKKAGYDEKVVAIGDKLSNLRAIARDYEKMGNEVWKIFHAPDPSLYEWRYRSLLDAFKGLEDTNPYKEFSHLIDYIWGKK